MLVCPAPGRAWDHGTQRVGWMTQGTGRPDHRGAARDDHAASRKVRAPQGRMVGNAHSEQSAGQCHRKQTARLVPDRVRVKRWCKRPPAPQVTAAARQTPFGARPNRMRYQGCPPEHPGWLLEARGNTGPRWMMVHDRTRLTGRPAPCTHPVRNSSSSPRRL